MSNKSRLGREIMGRRTTANTRGSHDSPSQGRLETGYKSHQSHGGKFRLVGPPESGIWIPKQLPSCGQSQKRGSSAKPPPGAPSSPAHLCPSAWRPFSYLDPGVTRCRLLLGQGYPADPLFLSAQSAEVTLCYWGCLKTNGFWNLLIRAV